MSWCGLRGFCVFRKCERRCLVNNARSISPFPPPARASVEVEAFRMKNDHVLSHHHSCPVPHHVSHVRLTSTPPHATTGQGLPSLRLFLSLLQPATHQHHQQRHRSEHSPSSPFIGQHHHAQEGPHFGEGIITATKRPRNLPDKAKPRNATPAFFGIAAGAAIASPPRPPLARHNHRRHRRELDHGDDTKASISFKH